jgi:chorismate dehydratase
VSFLNTRPLIEGLDRVPGVRLRLAVPSALPALLTAGEVDAALIPIIDLARNSDRWKRISDACIASDGETMTVRVFSRVPAEEMTTLYVDEDSHTSVVLADLIWRRWRGRQLKLISYKNTRPVNELESVLLIGDKVITSPLTDYPHQIDLGAEWKHWTGLPFVFAVWAAPIGGHPAPVAELLSAARDRGVAQASRIGAEWAPRLGWPVRTAVDYLTHHLKFTVTREAAEGMRMFLSLADEEGVVRRTPELVS